MGFNISVLLLVTCLGNFLDLGAKLSEYQNENRRKEKAGFIEEGDEEYDDLEEKVKEEVEVARVWLFVMAYLVRFLAFLEGFRWSRFSKCLFSLSFT